MPRRAAQREAVFLPPGVERYVIAARDLEDDSQTGGALTVYGQGSFGCVVSERSQCKLQTTHPFVEDPRKTYVYKLIKDHESFQNEVSINEMLTQELGKDIDIYTPVVLEACEVTIHPDAKYKCRIDPNLTSVYQIIYEYMGKDIYYYMHEAPRGQRPSLPTLLTACKQIADFMYVLSVNGWTHGDLRVENTLYDPVKGARVIDLGLAQHVKNVFDDPQSRIYAENILYRFRNGMWNDFHGAWFCPEKAIAHVAHLRKSQGQNVTVGDLHACVMDYYHKLVTISPGFIEAVFQRRGREFVPMAWLRIVSRFVDLSAYGPSRYSQDWKHAQELMKKVPSNTEIAPDDILSKLCFDVSNLSPDDKRHARMSPGSGGSVNKYDVFSLGIFLADICFGIHADGRLTTADKSWAEQRLWPLIRDACQPTMRTRMTMEEFSARYNEILLYLPQSSPAASSASSSQRSSASGSASFRALSHGLRTASQQKRKTAPIRPKILDSRAQMPRASSHI